MKRLPRTTIYKLCGLLAVIVLGGWGHLSMAVERTQEARTLTETLAKQKAVQSGLTDPAEVALIRTTIASRLEGGVTGLLTKITDEINTLDLRDYTVSTGAPTISNGVQIATINITLKGSYASTYELIQRITTYDSPVRIEEMIMTRNNTVADNDLSVLIRLSAITRFIRD